MSQEHLDSSEDTELMDDTHKHSEGQKLCTNDVTEVLMGCVVTCARVSL